MTGIQSGDPSYIIKFEGVEYAMLAECSKGELDKTRAYINEVELRSGAIIIETFSPTYYPIAGGKVPYFATHVLETRVEIFGRPSLQGDFGKDMIPHIKGCITSLGGKVTESG
jgi:hypothetical protein